MRERDLSHVAFSREGAASNACDARARRTPLSEGQLYNTIITGSVSSRLAIATHFFSCRSTRTDAHRQESGTLTKVRALRSERNEECSPRCEITADINRARILNAVFKGEIGERGLASYSKLNPLWNPLNVANKYVDSIDFLYC
jgi:hypothetical protein